jgi:hypothetical protein
MVEAVFDLKVIDNAETKASHIEKNSFTLTQK